MSPEAERLRKNLDGWIMPNVSSVTGRAIAQDVVHTLGITEEMVDTVRCDDSYEAATALSALLEVANG